MTTTLQGVTISPVNTTERADLGIKPGDTVRVHQKIVDQKGKARIQVFEGMVLARKHGTEPGATFTVRKVSSGVGVEKIFPLYSPNIDKIEIVRRAKVRRAKLYYIREKVAKEIKRQMRRMSLVEMSTESEAEATQRVEKEAAEAEAQAAEAAAAEEAKEAESDATEATVETDTAEPAEVEEPASETKADEPAPDVETESEEKKN